MNGRRLEIFFNIVQTIENFTLEMLPAKYLSNRILRKELLFSKAEFTVCFIRRFTHTRL